jgi:hypothetical protein
MALAIASACARRPATPAMPDATTRLPRFELKGNLLSFNGQALRFGDPLDSWLRVLGPPSESQTGRNWNDPIRHWYFGKSIEIEAYGTIDGRKYVGNLAVDLGDKPFPGVFVLQDVPLHHASPPLAVVDETLRRSKHPMVLYGWRRLKEQGSMLDLEPDGFQVSVLALFDCFPRLTPRSTEPCVQVIDTLEIGSTW